MINDQLRAVIDRALDRERISVEDVRELQREVFEHGLTCREEANVLAALDRAVPTADPLWAKFFIMSLVEAHKQRRRDALPVTQSHPVRVVAKARVTRVYSQRSPKNVSTAITTTTRPTM